MSNNRVNRFVANLSERQQHAPQGARARPRDDRRGAGEPTIDLMNPGALAKIGSLEIASRTVVDGILSGKHRSTHKGGYTDFSHFRPYHHGDDLRMLDWRQYARSDRYYVRQYDDETNLQALLVVDASGSMRFGLSTVSKWDYARVAAACLARLLMRQRDSVGLAVIGSAGRGEPDGGGGLREFLKPMPRASHLARLLDTLTKTEAAGESRLADSLTGLVPRLTRRGIVMILSDCFGPVEPFKHAVQQFRVRGHDVMVLQVLAPEERTFPFRRSSKFRDLESPRLLNLQPAEIRRHYLEKFNAFQHELAAAMSDSGCDLASLTTDQDLGETLAELLRARMALKKS